MYRLGGRSFLAALVGSLFLVGALNLITGFWALKRLERKAKTPIRGIFLPHLYRPAFTLRNAHLVWQERFEVLSGSVQVRYNPLTIVFGRQFRVQIQGSRLLLKLNEEIPFSSFHPGEIQVDQVSVDIGFLRHQDPILYKLVVKSPEMDFHFSEKGGNEVKAAGEVTEN